jgi:glycosyltransferase involved in cell wall biosynthesis
MIAWCHDLSWSNPLYAPIMHDGYPWRILREPAPHTTYIAVTELRRTQLLALWGELAGDMAVIPNGIDVFTFLRLSPDVRAIVDQFQLLDRDLVLLLPVRITRRKNIEAAIHTVRRLKDHGLNVRFLISGPQESQHPGLSDHYLDGLKALRAQLGVEEEMVFLAETLGHNLSSDTVAQLYDVADVLFFPSAQEGFGLPILEAAIGRVPIVVSDIPVFHEVAGRDVLFFGLHDPPEAIAGGILNALDIAPARLYRRVLREYRWESIADRQIVPLLTTGGRTTESP